MMEIIIRLEQNEVGRLFTTLGGGLMNIMQQRGPEHNQGNIEEVNIDDAGRIHGRIPRDRRRNEIRSTADIMDVISRMASDQGGSLFPPVEGEHDHRYCYLHTDHGNDIYVCQQDGCERRMTIPGRIIQPAPIVDEEQDQEVIEDEPEPEPEREGEIPSLPPGESEEADREDPPS